MSLYKKKTFNKHDHANICSTGAKCEYWKIAYSPTQSKMRATLRYIQNNVIQTYKMERFRKIIEGFEPSTIFAKRSILDVW